MILLYTHSAVASIAALSIMVAWCGNCAWSSKTAHSHCLNSWRHNHKEAKTCSTKKFGNDRL